MRNFACFALFALFGLIISVSADMNSCLTSQVISLSGTGYTFGCSGYGNSVTMTWYLNGNTTRTLFFQSFNTEACCDKVTVSYSGTVYGTYSGTSIPANITMGSGQIMVKFVTDSTTTAPGFTIFVDNGPTITALKSQQNFHDQTYQQGGFIYYALYNEDQGGNLTIDTFFDKYTGLQAPAVFVSRNILPSLENYGWTNTTTQSGSTYLNNLFISNPPTGSYFVGVFLYGISASLTITPTWRFNMRLLQNAEKITNTLSANTPAYYQILVPLGANSLQVQISRQVPGGYPILFIHQGVIPSNSNYLYKLDTTTTSYQTVTINNPNPYNNPADNPGNYIFAIQSDSASGYIFQVNFS